MTVKRNGKLKQKTRLKEPVIIEGGDPAPFITEATAAPLALTISAPPSEVASQLDQTAKSDEPVLAAHPEKIDHGTAASIVVASLSIATKIKLDPFTLLYAPSRFLIPEAERQYSIRSSLSKDEILKRLKVLQESPSEDLKIKMNLDHFQMKPKSCLLKMRIAQFFMPHMDGVVLIDENGETLLNVKASLSGFVSDLINCPPLAVVLILLSYLLSSYLLPRPILLFSSLIVATAVPLFLCFLATLASRIYFASQLQDMLTLLLVRTESSHLSISELEASAQSKKQLTIRFRADFMCAAVYLLMAFGLHAAAWQSWCAGQYQQCLNLCAPVKTLAQAVLGNNSATVGDCNYYLAECYRCLGRLKEADQAYGQAAQAMLPSLGKQNPFYADVLYNKGRVAEELENYPEAEKNILAALEIWKNSPEIGEKNIFYAKGLNRLAMLNLKMHKLSEAERLQKEALAIDQSYGQQALIGESENDLAIIEINLGRYQEALLLLQQAGAAKQERKMRLVPIYINLSQLYRLNGDQTKAQDFYGRAAQLLSEKRPPGLESVSEESLRSLSKSYKKSIDRSKADYEVPNFATRSNTTFNGDGQI